MNRALRDPRVRCRAADIDRCARPARIIWIVLLAETRNVRDGSVPDCLRHQLLDQTSIGRPVRRRRLSHAHHGKLFLVSSRGVNRY
jgi:hypothetical protein